MKTKNFIFSYGCGKEVALKKKDSEITSTKEKQRPRKKKEREKERKICINTENNMTPNKPTAWPWIKFSGRC